MAKVQTTGFVFMTLQYQQREDGSTDYGRERTWQPELWSCQVSDSDSRIFVSEQSLTVDVPADFNPVPAQVAALEAEKLAVLEKYQEAVGAINARLSKLLALEAA